MIGNISEKAFPTMATQHNSSAILDRKKHASEAVKSSQRTNNASCPTFFAQKQ